PRGGWRDRARHDRFRLACRRRHLRGGQRGLHRHRSSGRNRCPPGPLRGARMTRRAQWMVVAAVVLLLGSAAAVATYAMRHEIFPVTVGSRAPSFSAYTMDPSRTTKSIADYRGDVVLLNIWATWCGPCRIEMPEIQALHSDFA